MKAIKFIFVPHHGVGFWSCYTENYDYAADTGGSEHIGSGKTKSEALRDWFESNFDDIERIIGDDEREKNQVHRTTARAPFDPI